MRPHGRFVRLLTAVLLAVLAPGCAWLAPPPQTLPAETVATRLQQKATDFGGLQADLRLRISETVDGDTNKLPSLAGVLAFSATAPGMFLRAEKFTQEVFTLRALGQRFSLRLPRSNEVVVGGPFAYERLPYLVSPAEVKGAFAGPDLLGLTWPDTEMELTRSHYRFKVYVLGVLFRRVLVDRRRLVITRIERYDSLGRLHTLIELEDYAPVGESTAPRYLLIQRRQVSYDPPLSVTVRLDLDDVEPLKEGAEALMRPRVPRGWNVVDLDREPLSNIRALDLE